MWLMTSFGILMPAVRPAKTIQPGDDRTMQIRTRRAKELDILRAEYMKGTLGPTIHTPAFDYEYRAYCTPHAFALAMAQLITEIDYTKFKPTTDRYADHELHHCYNAIWGVVIARLSTKGHQTEYWHGTRSYAGKGAARGGSAASSAWSYSSGTGYPLPTGSTARRGALPAGTDDVPDDESYEGWLRNYRQRNMSAVRDEYEPDPALDELTSDLNEIVGTGIAEVDALYGEIDKLLDVRDLPLDHSNCDHGNSNNARARCRRKHQRADDKRIAELRQRIDDLYHERTEHGAAEAEADAAADAAVEEAAMAKSSAAAVN